jgi:hypothetical protein
MTKFILEAHPTRTELIAAADAGPSGSGVNWDIRLVYHCRICEVIEAQDVGW